MRLERGAWMDQSKWLRPMALEWGEQREEGLKREEGQKEEPGEERTPVGSYSATDFDLCSARLTRVPTG